MTDRDQVEQAQADGEEDGVVDERARSHPGRRQTGEQDHDEAQPDPHRRPRGRDDDHPGDAVIATGGVAARAVQHDGRSIPERPERSGVPGLVGEHGDQGNAHPGQQRARTRMGQQAERPHQQEETGLDLDRHAQEAEAQGRHDRSLRDRVAVP